MGRTNYHYPKILKTEDGKFYFEDYKGGKSKTFISATNYQNGFSIVKEKSIYEREKYRDLVGNVTDKQTELGRDFYLFCKGQLTVSQLYSKYFTCYPFYQAVLDASWTRLTNAQTQGRITPQEATKRFERISRICYDKRRSAKDRQKKNKEIKQYFNEKEKGE